VALVTALGKMKCQVTGLPYREGLVCPVVAANLDSYKQNKTECQVNWMKSCHFN